MSRQNPFSSALDTSLLFPKFAEQRECFSPVCIDFADELRDADLCKGLCIPLTAVRKLPVSAEPLPGRGQSRNMLHACSRMLPFDSKNIFLFKNILCLQIQLTAAYCRFTVPAPFAQAYPQEHWRAYLLELWENFSLLYETVPLCSQL